MSRSGFSDDDCYDEGAQWAAIRWQGTVKSAIRGKRGQAFLRDLERALDAMRTKKLIANELERTDPHPPEEGSVCAIGALGKVRGIDMTKLDPENWDAVAAAFGIAAPLAREIVYMNDDWSSETPEERYARMLTWVRSLIKPAPPANPS
jgi:hypothetical protein